MNLLLVFIGRENYNNVFFPPQHHTIRVASHVEIFGKSRKITLILESPDLEVAGLEMRNTKSGSGRKMIIQLLVTIVGKRLV